LLAREGLRVTLIDRETFPRRHVGESLLPASMPILADLGLLDDLEAAGFPKKWGASMVWGVDDERWSWRFEETNRRWPHAYQVDRAQFDHLLLQGAASRGVRVLEGCAVHSVEFQSGEVRVSSADGDLRARMVVDASGQSALVANQTGTRSWDPFFRNVAVYGYYRDFDPLDAPDENNIFVEAAEAGWSWLIPLGERASVGMVLDKDAVAHRLNREGLADFLSSCLGPETRRMLAGAKFEEGPYVERDWSYCAERFVMDSAVLVGDAACFVDPLFSSGVHLALSGGVLAAAYANTLICDPEFAPAAALEYERLYRQQYDHFHQLAKLFYASNRTHGSYFWETRRLSGDDRFTPRQAFVRAVAGQPPQGYERVVLDKGELPDEFRQSVAAIVGERSGRVDAPVDWSRAVPSLVEGSAVVARPLLESGRFVKGQVLVSLARPEGVPCSALVEALVSRIDGRTDVSRLVARLAAEVGARSGPELTEAVNQTLAILHVEGMLTVSET
jgi:flavin-dependent dehydrogenase